MTSLYLSVCMFYRFYNGILYWFAYLCIIGGFVESSAENIQDFDNDVTISKIRQLAEKNESLISLIKMDYKVKFSYSNPELMQQKLDRLANSNSFRKPSKSVLFSYWKGTWAQDRLKQYQIRDFWFEDESNTIGDMIVINGEVLKTATNRNDLMNGNIAQMERLKHDEIIPLAFGLQNYPGKRTIRDILNIENIAICGEEMISNRRAYIVEAVYGTHIDEPQKYRLKIWIDKEAGVPLQIQTYSNSNNKPSGEPGLIREIKDVQLHKLPNGGWFPIKATRATYFSDRISYLHLEINPTSITIERDEIRDSLFDIEFPEGAKVYNAILKRTYIVGQPGDPALDPKPLIGKMLPKFETKNFSVEEMQNKRILVCFFDREQRPSRNCILQLSKRAQGLKEKDIIIAAIQASKIEQTKLDEWIKENEISFPVGMIERDSEKTRFAWCVQSLPWLVLTDKNHIVMAEGFNTNDLDKNIKQ